ncbi:hypothetical protein GOP47_0008115 [Adiantum capillus-veneris]|uniref:Uncharacterized protein n=1 Tax=Adiantum capillus-veneris TaxID=13818 RepID=A0A9D4UXM3_ADICA|nr:hypothetical protein GOP47_0008115 [Adiantum capillus-veneris]
MIYEGAPEPMSAPYVHHVVDGDTLCLGQEKEGEGAHNEEPYGEEEEDAKLESAEHREERLRDDELEEHIGKHCHALRCRSDVLREDLAGNEPCQGPP